ncbi:hypothetical protein L6452_31126 [Arctium lappa]|uniref:Uncharacterized protein n=1 Tax=Arctium lappa TaxID=4217 RepID=A0ACB8ZJ25_ARCLA|nr:hypothetical protein L6452_31126 [Arctium lappa]
MVEKIGDEGGDCSLPDEQRCKRSDGRKWRCRRPVMQGRTLCEAHFAQSHYRKQREPVPHHLKLERSDPPQIDQESPKNQDGVLPQKRTRRNNLTIRANGDVGCSNLQGKRSKKEEKSSVDISEKLDDALRKMNLEKGDLQLDLIRGCLMRQVEKKKEKQLTTKENVVRDLKYGRLEISQSPVSSRLISATNAGSLNVKVGVPAPNFFPRRVFRSKNIEPLPIATMQILPSVKAKVKVVTKKKKCHWCRKCGYRNLIKCSTCKKHIFCEDCVQARCLDKTNVKKKCPVCCGTCDCRACIKERSKDVKTKDLVVYNSKKKFDKSEQLLYMIDMLLPLLEQINQEKTIELNMEAKLKERHHTELQIQPAIDSEKQQCCSFCKSCIVDVHRRCGNCLYMLCISCCWDFREGQLHGGFRDFKYMSTEKRKFLSTILWNWNTSEDGSIKCPPKNLGGCGNGVLDIRCLFDFNWTKDLETSAKEIICSYKFTKSLEVPSCCSLSDGNAEKGNESDDGILFKSKCLYLSTRDDLRDGNLEHFTQHWVKGQPLIIRDMVKNNPELKWDPVFMFCTYLEASAKYQKDEGGAKLDSCSDWYEVEMGRKQIFMGGKTHANVQNEVLKFRVHLSSVFFQQHFPSHYAAMMNDLPLHEYINPLSGLLNLASKLPQETQKLDLGPLIHISYGRPGEPIDADFSTKLCYHAFDVVNILVHATEIPISEKKLSRVKNLMNKYGSQDHNESSSKTESQNKIDDFFGKSSVSSDLTQTNEELSRIPNGEVSVLSDDSSIEVSDDEDLYSNYYGEKLVLDTHGAVWDVFRRQDVPKIIEYLRKYSNELKEPHSSPKKVVHPVLDESFYLDAFHKRKLKEEFDIEPWTFEQHIGEAVVIPAGCPYQIKKIKSCVNLVLEFLSPESASECFKLTEELRRLPMNHKAKGKMLAVKKMIVYCIDAAVEEISKVSHAEINGVIEE